MLLLITGSLDPTADRIVAAHGEGIFRLNYDLWKDYDLAFTQDGWEIGNPAGLSISSKTVTKVFWWKAFQYYNLDEDKLISAEVRYIFKEIYSWCAIRKMAKGNFIDWHNRYGKMNLLNIAKDYFPIPETLVTIRKSGVDRMATKDIVAKSLSSEISSENTVMATTAVNPDVLDPAFPWYLQAKIDSLWDVTVFQCGERLFAFKRSRKDLKGLDWRTEQTFDYSKKEWHFFELDSSSSEKIIALSSKLGIEFGRYDFMTDMSDNLWFLEVNANGQWVFLDFFNEYGLLDCVVDWLKN